MWHPLLRHLKVQLDHQLDVSSDKPELSGDEVEAFRARIRREVDSGDD